MSVSQLTPFQFCPALEQRPRPAICSRARPLHVGRAEGECAEVYLPSFGDLASLAFESSVGVPEDERVSVVGQNGFCALDGAGGKEGEEWRGRQSASAGMEVESLAPFYVMRRLERQDVERIGRILRVKHPKLFEDVAG